MSLQDELTKQLPWYLHGPNGGKMFEAYAAVCDMLIETQVQGLQQGDPLRCDESALPLIGSHRGLRRYPTESVASYRSRLAGWREMKRHWGSHYAQMKQLQLWFSPQAPTIKTVHQSGDGVYATWHTLFPDGRYTVQSITPSNWDWDSDYGLLIDSDVTSKRGRYWMIVHTDLLDPLLLVDTARWDAGEAWDGGALWGGMFYRAQIDDMISVTADWKAAHSELWGLIFASDPDSFDPTSTSAVESGLTSTTLPVGNWRFGVDWSTGELTRLSTAVFAFDRGSM